MTDAYKIIVQNQWRRMDSVAPDKVINKTMIRTATNDPIKDPVMRSQKFWYCWQIADQFAEALPLCAKYTIAAAAEAPAASTPCIICRTDKNKENHLK